MNVRKRGSYKDHKKLDPGKSTCQTWHAMKRAKERLGIRLTESDIASLTKEIIKSDSEGRFKVKLNEVQSNRVKVYRCNVNDIEIDVVFDESRQSIVTFLFPEIGSKRITHFIDLFGNRVNTKEETGKFWMLKNESGIDMLEVPGENVEMIKDWLFVVDFYPNPRIFEYDGEVLTEVPSTE